MVIASERKSLHTAQITVCTEYFPNSMSTPSNYTHTSSFLPNPISAHRPYTHPEILAGFSQTQKLAHRHAILESFRHRPRHAFEQWWESADASWRCRKAKSTTSGPSRPLMVSHPWSRTNTIPWFTLFSPPLLFKGERNISRLVTLLSRRRPYSYYHVIPPIGRAVLITRWPAFRRLIASTIRNFAECESGWGAVSAGGVIRAATRARLALIKRFSFVGCD